MYPEYQEWFIKADNFTARFGAENNAQGKPTVTVRLEQVVNHLPQQAFACNFAVIAEAVKQGEGVRDKLTYREGLSLRQPDGTLDLPDHRVSYYARLKPNGEEQLAILFVSKQKGEGEAPQKFLSDLDHLKEFAEAGHEYEETLDRARRWQPVLQIVEPGATRDRAFARVIEQSTTRTEGQSPKVLSVEQGQLMAHKNPGLIFWPEPMTYVPKGRLIEVTTGNDARINRAIEYAHFDQERRSTTHVLGRWAMDAPRPNVGEKVAWGGKPQGYDGSPLDYLVDRHGRADGKDIRPDAPFVLLRRSDTEPYRGEVVAVCPTREEAVRALDDIKRTESVKQQLEPDWSRDLKPLKRPH